MDPTTIFCPNAPGHARGHTGMGHRGIHAQKEPRCIGHACHKTFSARQGTVCYRLRTSAEPMGRMVTVRAHGCPLQAIVAACGFDERTVADWWARSGRQGQAVQECLVERPWDVGQGQADARRVKQQGGLVWRALARMVKPRVWLGGEVSEQRDMALIRRLSERGRRCAAYRPLLGGPEGWCADRRAMRETWRAPGRTGQGGRPRRRPWCHGLLAQVVTRYARRRVVETECRLVDGPPARVETLRRRSPGDGVIKTAYLERLNAPCRERLAPLARRGRALARPTRTLEHGRSLLGTV